jgi:hypothetical protein
LKFRSNGIAHLSTELNPKRIRHSLPGALLDCGSPLRERWRVSPKTNQSAERKFPMPTLRAAATNMFETRTRRSATRARGIDRLP